MSSNHRAAGLAAAGLIGLISLTACSSSNDAASSSGSTSKSPAASSSSGSSSSSASGSPSASASKVTAVVTIKDYKYGGAGSVPAGATITVKNDDTEAHTLTSDAAGAFDVKIDPGKSATFTAPAKAGSFPYHCTYHGNMRGTLKVG